MAVGGSVWGQPEHKEQVTVIRRVFLAFLVFGMVGCGGDDVFSPESVAGTYTLQTLNGDALPAVRGEIGTSFTEVTAGSIILNENLSCSTSLSLQVTEGSTVTPGTVMRVCTYTLSSEGAITLIDAANPLDPTPATGSLTGSSMTITEDEDVYVYQKSA